MASDATDWILSWSNFGNFQSFWLLIEQINLRKFKLTIFSIHMLICVLFAYHLVCWWRVSLGAVTVTVFLTTRVATWQRRHWRRPMSPWSCAQAMTCPSTATITRRASKNSAMPRSRCRRTWPCSRLSTATRLPFTSRVRRISHIPPISREMSKMVKLRSPCTWLFVAWKSTMRKS